MFTQVVHDGVQSKGETMKKLAAVLIVLGLLVAVVPTVLADDSDPTTGEITITGAPAHVSTTAFVLAGHTLNGTDLGNANYLEEPFSPSGISSGTYTGLNKSWVMTDPRGTGAGWTINVKATDFTAVSGPGAGEMPAATIPLIGTDKHSGQNLFFMYLPSSGIVWVDGQFDSDCTTHSNCAATTEGDLMPVTGVFLENITDSPIALTSGDQLMISAGGDKGMGTYQMNPQFRLFVPAETYAGRYTSTVTLTLSASEP